MTRTPCIWIAALWAAGQLAAQTAPSFSYSTESAGGAVAAVSSGGTIQLPVTAVGSSSAITLIVTSANASQWTLAGATVTGQSFSTTVTSSPIPAGSSVLFLITTTPLAAGQFTGTLALTLAGPGGQQAGANFNLAVTAVNGVLLSYLAPPNQIQTLLAPGSTIPFPATAVSATTTLPLTITNRSANTVTLNAALLSGSAFQLASVPLLPEQIAPGQQAAFSIVFAPGAPTADTGTLTVTLNNVPATFGLTGTGTAAVFTYQTGAGSSAVAISPGGTIAMGSAEAGSGQTQTTVTVQNNGNTNGVIFGISVNNSNYILPDLPALPVTLAPGGQLSFTVDFAPLAVGSLTGTLSIGGVPFSLTGTGLGSSLNVTVTAGGQQTTIPVGGTASLPNTSVGSMLTFTMTIANVGNQPATITALAVVGTDMALSQGPALPLTIAPGASVPVTCTYIPQSTGIVNGYLQVQDQTYGLRVVGAPPPALPALTFTNVSAQMSPLQQPALGLTLSAPYPYPLTGVLNLAFAADVLGDDPNVQFIAGARFVNFTIPANSTQAQFGSGQLAAPFQTGTTAGVITLSASLALGPYNLTSGGPITQMITIPQSAPAIVTVAIASESASSVTLLITGYSTPRSVQQLSFQLVPATGAALQTTSLSTDVTKPFDTWFQSQAGVSFGSQFSATVQLNVSGNLDTIASVAVVASNAVGASAPQSISLN